MNVYTIKPVGLVISSNKNNVFCIIKKDYIPALQLLDNFSHILLITREKPETSETTTTIIQNLFDTGLYLTVVRIISINEKKGIIVISNFYNSRNV